MKGRDQSIGILILPVEFPSLIGSHVWVHDLIYTGRFCEVFFFKIKFDELIFYFLLFIVKFKKKFQIFI